MSNDPQARLRDAETTYQPMHARDLAAVHRLAQQMSWPHRPEDCAQMLQLGSGVVAVDAVGATIGVGMRWSFGDGVGTIGMMLVERERQGRGIGRALMTSLIADSSARALMLNATAEGLGLYEKLGFVPAGLVHQHQGRVGESPVLPAAPSVPVTTMLRGAWPAQPKGPQRFGLALQALG